jgi:hypothetical protein
MRPRRNRRRSRRRGSFSASGSCRLRWITRFSGHRGDRVVISSEGNVLTFKGKAPQTAEIAQFEAPVLKRKLN